MNINIKLISHRGNLNGSLPKKENSPKYIQIALDMGYDVEIDVWYIDSKFFLGHDKPQYEIEKSFLKNSALWVHCKNIEALYQLIENKEIKCFFHNTDAVTLTSNGYLWTYPNNKLTPLSICVLPELYHSLEWRTQEIYGICSDFIGTY